MADELPPCPGSWETQTRYPAKRKRVEENGVAQSPAEFLSNSSDPAIFSSDNDPALDNYVHGRNKKQYVGSWYHQRPASSESPQEQQQLTKAHRAFKRQFDSGVFMGSDSSNDDILDELLPLPKAKYPRINQPTRPSQVSTSYEAETIAQQKIRRCIDDGKETVDLSGLGLEQISNSSIAALSEFMWIPTVEKGVPFEQKDPAMQLYLYNNSLTRVPAAIFSLEHLTVLSLRGNRLEELPPTISKLKNLWHLNVSQNLLRYLPIELLDLIANRAEKLETLVLHPNPFVQPESAEAIAEGETLDEVSVNQAFKRQVLGTRFAALMQARTPIQFSDTKGTIYSEFNFGPGNVLRTEDLGSIPKLPSRQPRLASSTATPMKPTKVPTLLELALQSCARAPQLDQLHELLPEDAPEYLSTLLGEAHVQREMGGLACFICKKGIIKPTAQWVEWWQIYDQNSDLDSTLLLNKPLAMNPDERLVPFLRRACSWGCALDPEMGLGRSHTAEPVTHSL